MKCEYVCWCDTVLARVTDRPGGHAPLFLTWRCPACASEYQLVSDVCPPLVGVSGKCAERLARVKLLNG